MDGVQGHGQHQVGLNGMGVHPEVEPVGNLEGRNVQQINGQGGHNPIVYGNGANQQAPAVPQAAYAPAVPAPAGGYGPAAAGGGAPAAAVGNQPPAAAAGNGGFAITGRNNRPLSLNKGTVDLVESKFNQFKALILGRQRINPNAKVFIDMNTRIVRILEDNGTVTNVALSILDTRDHNSVEYQMVRLVQDMGNELVVASVMNDMDKTQNFRDFQNYQRHMVGSPVGKNAFLDVMKDAGRATKERMLNNPPVANLSQGDKDVIIGLYHQNQQVVVDRANEIKTQAETLAQQTIAAIDTKIAVLRAANDQDAADIEKLEKEKALLQNNGALQLIAMVRARVEEDLATAEFNPQTGAIPSTRREEIKQELAKRYLSDIKVYFQTEKASGRMGTDTRNGLILSRSDDELATLIVATAVFSGAVNHTMGAQTDDHKQGYNHFMQSNGYTQNKNLGDIGTIFSLIQTEQEMIEILSVNGGYQAHPVLENILNEHHQCLRLLDYTPQETQELSQKITIFLNQVLIQNLPTARHRSVSQRRIANPVPAPAGP